MRIGEITENKLDDESQYKFVKRIINLVSPNNVKGDFGKIVQIVNKFNAAN